MSRFNRDLGAGLLFAGIGAFFAAYSLRTLDIGTAFRMGPGFFPLLIASLLALFGLFILGRGALQPAQGFGAVPWRTVILLPAALVAFGLGVRPLGLLPSLLILCLLASLASASAPPRQVVGFTLGVTAFGVLLFRYLLNLSLPLWGDVFY